MAGLWTDQQAGPASYSTGGFSVATGLSTVEAFDVEIQTPHANLGQVVFDVTVSGANATVKIMQVSYDKLTAIGDMNGLPSGISAQTVSGGTYDTTSHTHAIDHNHAATPASTTAANQTANTLAAAAQPNVTTHTHTLDLPNFTANAVADTGHTHTWNNIYQHQHALTNTATNLSTSELANATDISGATFIYHAVGTE